MVRRFDRIGAARLHLHSLGGMQHVDYNQPGAFSYEQYLRTVLDLNLGYPACRVFHRMVVFNLAAVNQTTTSRTSPFSWTRPAVASPRL
jgi:serine/threonine-protein kinase HipA